MVLLELLADSPTVALKLTADGSKCRSNWMPVTELDWDTKVIGRRRLAPGAVAVLMIDIWAERAGIAQAQNAKTIWASAVVSAALKQDNVFRFEAFERVAGV